MRGMSPILPMRMPFDMGCVDIGYTGSVKKQAGIAIVLYHRILPIVLESETSPSYPSQVRSFPYILIVLAALDTRVRHYAHSPLGAQRWQACGALQSWSCPCLDTPWQQCLLNKMELL